MRRGAHVKFARVPRKRILLTALLVLVGLAATAAVASAAIPAITNATKQLSVNSAAVHTVRDVVTSLASESDGTTGSVEGSDECTRGVEANDTNDDHGAVDHHAAVSKGHGSNREAVGDHKDANDQAAEDQQGEHEDKAGHADEHETVKTHVEERDDAGSQSVDPGGAGHDGSHQKAEGSSD